MPGRSLTPGDRERLERAIQAYLNGETEELEIEHRLRHRDGSYQWTLDNHRMAVRDPEHTPSRLSDSSVRTSDLTRAEGAMEASERFRTFVDLANGAFFLMDDRWVVLDVNEQACQSLEYTRGELLGMTPFDFDPDASPARSEELDRNLNAGETVSFESRHRRKGGGLFAVDVRGRAFWDAGRRFLLFLSVDLTAQKRAEQANRESEERLRGTFESAGVGIGHLDFEGRWLRVNQLHCDILGYTREEMLKMSVFDLSDPAIPGTLEHLQQLASGKVSGYSIERHYMRKDGVRIWTQVTTSVQRDAAGEPAYVIAVMQDITERKRLEAQLLQAKETAEAANRAKDEFLANVSHEIRTPMNAILGMTELVLDTALAEDQRQCLKTVTTATQNLLGIIEDLLDFSKIEAGKLKLDSTDFSLRAAVRDTLRVLAIRAHKKGLELVCNIRPDVPDALVGDAGRLRQVLLNLVGNAIKFTEHGEVVLRVQADATAAPAREARLRFTVRDTGIGIHRDKQATIFRAFEQEDSSTTRNYGGTGLGLTISLRLAGLMGGSIGVASEPGQGSTFSLTALFGRAAQLEPAGAVPPVLLQNLRVLVVDDNAANRDLVEEWLRGWQMEPTAVGDAMAAMDALQDGATVGRPYELALLDAWMPDADGLTLAATIRGRAELSGSRIILFTSGDRPGDGIGFRQLPVDGYLSKPVQQDELLEAIYSVMSRANGGAPAASRPARAAEPLHLPALAVLSLNVLVAEDNELNALLFQELLARRGHSVCLARDGQEAQALADHAAFDLLLLDLHMPVLDGFDVIRAIRERELTTGGHLPVIALTARSQREGRDHCLAAGMDDFLAKPIQPAEMWMAIDRLMAAHPPAARPRRGLLDAKVLLAACGGDAGILERICQALRVRMPHHLAAIQQALRDQDAPRLREAAHKACGMVSTFSTAAAAVASYLEDCAARGQLEGTGSLVEQLDTMVRDLTRLLDTQSIDTLLSEAGKS